MLPRPVMFVVALVLVWLPLASAAPGDAGLGRDASDVAETADAISPGEYNATVGDIDEPGEERGVGPVFLSTEC